MGTLQLLHCMVTPVGVATVLLHYMRPTSPVIGIWMCTLGPWIMADVNGKWLLTCIFYNISYFFSIFHNK